MGWKKPQLREYTEEAQASKEPIYPTSPQRTLETSSRLDSLSSMLRRKQEDKNPQMKKLDPTSLLCKDLAPKHLPPIPPQATEEGIFLQRKEINCLGQLLQRLTLQCKALHILKFKDPKVYRSASCPLTLQWAK